MALFNTSTANFLEKNEKLDRQECINLEKEKLKSTDKIHNFTNTNLTPDFTELLNKGTNFIPTMDNINTKTIKKTVNEEVNNALCTLIRKQQPYCSKLKTPKSKFRFKPHHTQKPLTLLKQNQNRPSFNIYVIDYVHNTTSYTKHLLQSTHNPPTSTRTRNPHTTIQHDIRTNNLHWTATEQQ